MAEAEKKDKESIHIEKVNPIQKRVYHIEPTKFKLGASDLLKLKNALISAIKERPNVDDPLMHAQEILDCCLGGIKKDGRIWYRAPKTLSGRLKLYGFDMETMKALSNFGTGGRPRKTDPDIPREINQKGNTSPTMVAAPLSGEEKREYNRLWKDYLAFFPHMKNPADLGVLELLVRFQILSRRRVDMVLKSRSTGPGMANLVDREIGENIKKFQETLGIAGNQRMKLMGNITSGSVAELVKRFEAYTRDGKYLEVELLWWKEEAAMLLRKADREFPDGNPEMTDAVFERLMGVRMDVAREIVKDPYSKSLSEARKKAIAIMREKDNS